MSAAHLEQATFGAGCFWGVEAVFAKVPGVASTAAGYMGGTRTNPSYEDVCTGTTGHAEVVHLTYDPQQVTYDELLAAFWDCHDPTQLNRQGPDFGTQYRTVIFYHSDEQKAAAERSKAALAASGKLSKPIATQIAAAGPFYRAEEYHQRYFERHNISCHI
jgi:peptide-methionine (S)-S-oxide reductase